MPASTSAIMKNIERLKDQALIDLWNQTATEDRTPGQAWAAFIEEADNLRLADKIPGSVGRSFRRRYADEAPKETAAPPAKPGPKAKRTTTAASRPAPASAGSKAGGPGRSRSKAAQAGEKKAAAK